MTDRIIRVYADTSVFGGVFDEEFEKYSRIFFDQVRQGKLLLVTSALVREELSEAPSNVRRFFEDILPITEISDFTEESIRLQQVYLTHGILGVESLADALHVAHATVSNCHVIVSWNFKHIVHFEKIPLYKGVNKASGYHEIDIHSPQEVIFYENEDI